MSIKQNGGVFGRNPTFNDVTIEGDLIINGEVFTGLDFQGSWNASTNSPTLASSVGTNGEFYIVSIAGTTDLNGITNWGIGDWAIFNGTVWQRVEGGADGNFNDLTVAGTSTLTGNVGIGESNPAELLHLTATTPVLRMEGTSRAYQQYVSGTSFIIRDVSAGLNRVTLDSSGNVNVSTGNVIIGTSGKGIDFSATAGTGTSELLDDYEEGTFSITSDSGQVVIAANTGYYTKVGRVVTCTGAVSVASIGTPVGNVGFDGLPFATANATNIGAGISLYTYGWKTSMTTHVMASLSSNSSAWFVQKSNGAGSVAVLSGDVQATTYIQYTIVYQTA